MNAAPVFVVTLARVTPQLLRMTVTDPATGVVHVCEVDPEYHGAAHQLRGTLDGLSTVRAVVWEIDFLTLPPRMHTRKAVLTHVVQQAAAQAGDDALGAWL